MNDDKPVSELLDDFQRRGRYGFGRGELEAALPGSSPAAIGKALQRLARKGRVKRLRGGFHAIVPVEFTTQGLPPYDWYLDDLMRSLELPYYVGLLSAAALHGAAHQQVQQLQLVVPGYVRRLEVPGLSVRFFPKPDFAATPLLHRKGHSGMLPVSTPEATALDLIRHARHLGGLDAVLTVLTELAESMTTAGLVTAAAAETATSQLQRLGWLLDRLGQSALADALHSTLPKAGALSRALLDPTEPRTGNAATNRWRIIENTQPEADL
jgi:predicted transcriptional regulator of viral defense system